MLAVWIKALHICVFVGDSQEATMSLPAPRSMGRALQCLGPIGDDVCSRVFCANVPSSCGTLAFVVLKGWFCTLCCNK